MKLLTNKDLLYSMGDYIQHFVINYKGKECKIEHTHTHTHTHTYIHTLPGKPQQINYTSVK